MPNFNAILEAALTLIDSRLDYDTERFLEEITDPARENGFQETLIQDEEGAARHLTSLIRRHVPGSSDMSAFVLVQEAWDTMLRVRGAAWRPPSMWQALLTDYQRATSELNPHLKRNLAAALHREFSEALSRFHPVETDESMERYDGLALTDGRSCRPISAMVHRKSGNIQTYIGSFKNTLDSVLIPHNPEPDYLERVFDLNYWEEVRSLLQRIRQRLDDTTTDYTREILNNQEIATSERAKYVSVQKKQLAPNLYRLLSASHAALSAAGQSDFPHETVQVESARLIRTLAKLLKIADPERRSVTGEETSWEELKANGQLEEDFAERAVASLSKFQVAPESYRFTEPVSIRFTKFLPEFSFIRINSSSLANSDGLRFDMLEIDRFFDHNKPLECLVCYACLSEAGFPIRMSTEYLLEKISQALQEGETSFLIPRRDPRVAQFSIPLPPIISLPKAPTPLVPVEGDQTAGGMQTDNTPLSVTTDSADPKNFSPAVDRDKPSASNANRVWGGIQRLTGIHPPNPAGPRIIYLQPNSHNPEAQVQGNTLRQLERKELTRPTTPTAIVHAKRRASDNARISGTGIRGVRSARTTRTAHRMGTIRGFRA